MPRLRDESRNNYAISGSDYATLDELKTGCLQRIADACEAMAKDRFNLEWDLAWLRERYKEHIKTIETMKRSNAALRGYINRMKKESK